MFQQAFVWFFICSNLLFVTCPQWWFYILVPWELLHVDRSFVFHLDKRLFRLKQSLEDLNEPLLVRLQLHAVHCLYSMDFILYPPAAALSHSRISFAWHKNFLQIYWRDTDNQNKNVGQREPSTPAPKILLILNESLIHYIQHRNCVFTCVHLLCGWFVSRMTQKLPNEFPI